MFIDSCIRKNGGVKRVVEEAKIDRAKMAEKAK